jgi:endonuclease/exonuclease/phosphatase (EEP) superfamily protein YafD
MRIIFFNIWHGHEKHKLEEFINTQKSGTDIFAFVEVGIGLQEDLFRQLKEYKNSYNKGSLIEYHGGVFQGHSVFVKPEIEINNAEFDPLFVHTPNDAGGLMSLDLKIKGREFHLGLVHGQARPGSKKDTESRLKQSQIIINKFKDMTGPVVIGGDFNLDADTRSIQMFEVVGFRNLIKEFSIKETRNRLCWEQFPEDVKKYGKQHFADFCFVKNIKVENFEVPNVEASDHEPQILEFELE